MRLSLWQQYSSNNSSSYVVVGAFQSPEKAQEAALEFKKLLQHLWEHYQAHPELREDVLSEEDHDITHIELEAMHDYHIEFDAAIEWVAREKTLDFLPDAVATFENMVFVATVDETVTNDTPIAQFMHRLGADVKFEEALDAYLRVQVTATAPDDITAQFIKTSCDTYFVHQSPFYRAPWVLFFDGQLAPNQEQLSRDIDLYIAYDDIWRKLRQQRRYVTAQLAAAQQNNDTTQIVALEQRLASVEAEYATQPHLSDEVERHIHKILCWTCIDTGGIDKTVALEDHKISFPPLYFSDDDMGHGLPALVTWLRALGCVDVIYEFVPILRR
jgi:hypothetical protein